MLLDPIDVCTHYPRFAGGNEWSKIKTFRQGFPRTPLIYLLALKLFLRKLKVNPFLCGTSFPRLFSLPMPTTPTLTVTSSIEIDEAGREIKRYETGTRSTAIRWACGWARRTEFLFPNLSLEMNWSREGTVCLPSQRNLSLKRDAEVCASYIYPILLYRLFVNPFSSTILVCSPSYGSASYLGMP